METYYTPREVAERWRVSRPTIQGMLSRGTLRALKVAGQWRIAESTLQEYEAEHTNAPTAAAPPVNAKVWKIV
jgi:excisionase family DNA binding protein